MNDKTFKLGPVTLEYDRTVGYNNPYTNERTIELPLARLFLSKVPEDRYVTEVGCVTPYYWESAHGVMDLDDPHPRAQPIDASAGFLWNGNYVLSISTVEHMKDPVKFMLKLGSADRFLVTFPVGVNTVLDIFMLEYVYPQHRYTYIRESVEKNNWERRDCLWTETYQRKAEWGGLQSAVCVYTNIMDML